MNKTKIAISVVVSLGVIWTVAAWFSGKQLEKNIDQLVQHTNIHIQNSVPESRLRLNYQNFQRGIFSSSVRFVLQSISQTEDNSVLKPGQSIVFKESIYHGPFPLAQLKKFNLIPSMLSVHSELENTDAVKNLFEITQGRSIIEAETCVGYDGSINSDIKLMPADYNDPRTGKSFMTNGGNLQIRIDDKSKGDKKVAFRGNIGSATLTRKNKFDMPVLFTLNGFNFNTTTYRTPKGMHVATQQITLKKLAANVDGKDAVQFDGINGKSNFHSNNGKISGQMDYTLNKMIVRGQDFGESSLVLRLTDFDVKAMKMFLENYNRQIMALVSNPRFQEDNKLYQQRSSEIFSTNLSLLLKGEPSVGIEPFIWRNAKGESILNLSAYFKNTDSTTVHAQNLVQQVENMLKKMDARLNISMDMASEMMTHVAIAEGHPQDEAARLADQQVKGLAAMGQIFKLTMQKDNNITSSLQYTNGQVTMNGEKMILQHFLARYMLGGAAMVTPKDTER